MVGFSALPDDLIIIIVSLVPSGTLRSLSLVSTAFNRCSTPQLYRYVYLWESLERSVGNHDAPNFPDWRSRYQHLEASPYRNRDQIYGTTRIFDLDLFLRTVTESEMIRSYVVGASITYRPDQEESVSSVVQLLRPSLSYLHLKCALDTMFRNRALLSYANCLEVEISERHDIDNQTRDLQNVTYKELILSYFDFPDMKLLALSGVRNWDLFMRNSPDRSSTSNITSLSLTNTVPADQGLAKLLSWPKALKSLRYELALSEISNHRRSPHPDRFVLSAKEFSDALQPHEHSLEELLIEGSTTGDEPSFDPRQLIDLHSFTNLRYVGLPLNFLFTSQSDASYYGISYSATAISQILPPALEELRIEMDYEYKWLKFFSLIPVDGKISVPFFEDTDLELEELSNFICEIAKNQDRRYTGLRSIVFEQSVYWRNQKIHSSGNEQCCAEVFEACKAASVQISWNGYDTPP
ncbi:hypothetical protein BCON_0013g00680 [Botryotinia convoluta]|uniref:F-box domain-containing protein n=1 Tax=Botryotinia convoluta TaxID=54673 RepID=A0A4Z1IV36_9HELO|nr:hypothetical protein BCON_0013g00680 [Botryotinia convoluta]